jgi:uncharacterized protein YecT (DUF1311 family)
MALACLASDAQSPLDALQRAWVQERLRDAAWVPSAAEVGRIRPVLLAWAQGIDARMAAMIEQQFPGTTEER